MKRFWLIYKKLLSSSRVYIYFAGILSVVWFFAGIATVTFFPSALPGFTSFLQEAFQNILGDVDKMSSLELTRALLIQNSTTSVYNIFLGGFLGIIPVISLAFNFFILGFLAGPFLYAGLFPGLGTTPLGFVLSIAPHGIFEIPAFLLSAAFGLRLGWAWILPGASGKRGEVFKASFLDALKALPLIIVLLVIAAFVEAFVTTHIVL